MQTVTTVAAVHASVREWRAAGRRVAFVPTMGNLHAGHMSLLSAARYRADHVVASVFVNPLQFGPNEDFARYPRSLAEDQMLLSEACCDLLFAPGVAEIYPDGDQPTRVHVRGLSETLCGQFRPGHFDGVATVVAKLFGIVGADVAVFGEKDYQQLLVIRRMAADLALPIEIVGAPTVRAADGLALSSRNRYLDEQQRARAPAIYQALHEAVGAIDAGTADYGELERRGTEALELAGMRVDYFAVRDAADLSEPRAASAELAVLTAAWLGRSRLIDNLRVHPPPRPLT
ncbi:MAG TPA: pantoate--beta-alanine ligase [Steroidobacteraceae bacterium]|nr:pantoate--beta-alanine ligase [Steroidobacteraceae bacterium]